MEGGPAALVDGVFDPLHSGHLSYFAAARAWLNYHRFTDTRLVCCVAPDTYVSRKHTPFLPESQRADLIRRLPHIDDVSVGPTLEVIRALRPTHYIKGRNWAGRLPAGLLGLCRELGISVKYVEHDAEGVSSTALLRDYQQRSNDAALGALSRFCAQQPHEKPWVPVVDYSFEARQRDEGELPRLIVDVLHPATVLDYGAGHGHLVSLLRARGVDAFGYEPFPIESHPYVKTVAHGLHADLVICREVFEHVRLVEWMSIIRDLVTKAHHTLLVTTRFHPRPLHLLDATWDGDREIDPTEITFVNRDLLRALFVLHGCRERPDWAAELDWQQRGNTLVFERP